MPEELFQKTATELRTGLLAGAFQSVDIVHSLLQRIETVDGDIGAFLHIDSEDALAQAAAADERRAAGKALSDWDGVPIALKDAIAVKGQPLTCASRMLENFVSPYDSTVATKLKAAGCVLLGRLNMDEFAMGSSTENSAVKPTLNPWNREHIPGGSSGGSAASVAALECPWSLGSDTGGSIRQPASHCGVVGVKPTYGRVSRWGLAAFASSLDQIGPLARTVEDAAALLELICGKDDRDSTSVPESVPAFREALGQPVKGLKVGLPKQYFGEIEGLDPEVREAVMAAARHYEAEGCELVEVDLPHADLAVPVYYIVATAEASSNLGRYDGVRYGHRSANASDAIDLYYKSRGEGFGEEVKRRIMLGTYVLSSGYYDAYYLKAQKARSLIRSDFAKAFEQADVLLAPTAPTPAFRRGENTEDPLAMYLADIFTIPANLAGIPGLSLPCGFSKQGLPIGLQLLGKSFDEASLLRFASNYEAAHSFAGQSPQL